MIISTLHVHIFLLFPVTSSNFVEIHICSFIYKRVNRKVHTAMSLLLNLVLTDNKKIHME